MRVVIIGGTGHVGTYLVPRLVAAGHEVVCVSRQQRAPYQANDAWNSVTMVSLDRAELERRGEFGKAILELNPEVVIDMICFTADSAQQLVEALRGKITHFLHCGTMWVHGHSTEVPTDETQPRYPFDQYGIDKAAIEAYLLQEAKEAGFPATLLHPGHIVGPGWFPVNPAGHLDPDVFKRLATGQEVILPNLGMETLHHVHADDVAQAFAQAILYRDVAIGQSFHVVSPKAITLRGYAEAIAKWFGQTANLKFFPWEEFSKLVSERDAELTWDHIAHSPCGSIEKARRLINYQPRYTSLEAVQEAIGFMKE
jgi:nucleoside-diphosphate-sugar epimerase